MKLDSLFLQDLIEDCDLILCKDDYLYQACVDELGIITLYDDLTGEKVWYGSDYSFACLFYDEVKKIYSNEGATLKIDFTDRQYGIHFGDIIIFETGVKALVVGTHGSNEYMFVDIKENKVVHRDTLDVNGNFRLENIPSYVRIIRAENLTLTERG